MTNRPKQGGTPAGERRRADAECLRPSPAGACSSPGRPGTSADASSWSSPAPGRGCVASRGPRPSSTASRGAPRSRWSPATSPTGTPSTGRCAASTPPTTWSTRSGRTRTGPTATGGPPSDSGTPPRNGWRRADRLPRRPRRRRRRRALPAPRQPPRGWPDPRLGVGAAHRAAGRRRHRLGQCQASRCCATWWRCSRS